MKFGIFYNLRAFRRAFLKSTEFKEKKMTDLQSNKVNLLSLVSAEETESILEIVRLGANETAIMPFTADSEAVDLHYCPEPEIGGYVICSGRGCILCRIGRNIDQRLLLPVYLPAAGCVGILPVSRSLRPQALLPQISSVLMADTPMVMFVTRNRGEYLVSTNEVRDDVDSGEMAIKRFSDNYECGKFDLSTVYQRIDNKQLADVEEISKMMKLKGVGLDETDQQS
jgi:hypothetical protein